MIGFDLPGATIPARLRAALAEERRMAALHLQNVVVLEETLREIDRQRAIDQKGSTEPA